MGFTTSGKTNRTRIVRTIRCTDHPLRLLHPSSLLDTEWEVLVLFAKPQDCLCSVDYTFKPASEHIHRGSNRHYPGLISGLLFTMSSDRIRLRELQLILYHTPGVRCDLDKLTLFHSFQMAIFDYSTTSTYQVSPLSTPNPALRHNIVAVVAAVAASPPDFGLQVGYRGSCKPAYSRPSPRLRFAGVEPAGEVDLLCLHRHNVIGI